MRFDSDEVGEKIVSVGADLLRPGQRLPWPEDRRAADPHAPRPAGARSRVVRTRARRQAELHLWRLRQGPACAWSAAG